MLLRKDGAKLRSLIRDAEIKRETNQQALDAEPRRDWGYYHPPFAERLPDGSLGPDYTVVADSTWERRISEYQQSRPGGGLWDEEAHRMTLPQEARDRAEARAASKVVQRYDAEKVTRYVERYPHRVSTRELEVYYAFYRDGLSKGAIARHLGTSKSNIENRLSNLRKKAREARAKKWCPLPPQRTDE